MRSLSPHRPGRRQARSPVQRPRIVAPNRTTVAPAMRLQSRDRNVRERLPATGLFIARQPLCRAFWHTNPDFSSYFAPELAVRSKRQITKGIGNEEAVEWKTVCVAPDQSVCSACFAKRAN